MTFPQSDAHLEDPRITFAEEQEGEPESNGTQFTDEELEAADAMED